MKKFFSIFMATALMLSFVACDKKDKSSDEPQNPDQPVVEDAVTLKIDSETGYVYWKDACESQGWWQIMAQNDKYFISLSNSGSIDAAPGIYTVAKLDADYSYIKDFAKDSAKVELESGKVTLVVNDGIVTVAGSLVGDDGITYNIDLKYVAPELVPSDMTFQFAQSENGITVTPSNNDDPWDYYIATAEVVAYYTPDGIAESVFEEEGDYYASPGAYTFPWSSIYQWCYDKNDNFVPGDYVLVVWGASEAGVTTPAASYGFTVNAEDEPASAPKNAPALVKGCFKGAKAKNIRK